MSDDAWGRVTERKETKNRMNMCQSPEESEELRRLYNLNRQVKACCKWDKRARVNELATKAQVGTSWRQEATNRGDSKELKVMKLLANKQFKQDKPVKNKVEVH